MATAADTTLATGLLVDDATVNCGRVHLRVPGSFPSRASLYTPHAGPPRRDVTQTPDILLSLRQANGVIHEAAA